MTFSTGFQSGSTAVNRGLEIKARNDELLKEREERKQKESRELFIKNLKFVSDSAPKMIAAGKTPEEARDVLAPFLRGLETTASTGSVPGLTPEILRSRVDSIFAAAQTPEQINTTNAAATKSTAQATAEGTAAGTTETIVSSGIGSDVGLTGALANSPVKIKKKSEQIIGFEVIDQAKGDSGFTLSPGGVRFDAEGKEIASVPKTSEPDQREVKIKALTERGISQIDAQNIVDGNKVIDVNPTTGQVLLIDKINNTVKELPKETGEPSPEEINLSPEEIEDAAIAEHSPADLNPEAVFGFVPVLSEFASKSLGAFFSSMEFPEVRQARSQLKLTREEIINALSKSGRPPVVEQQRILEAFPSLGLFESVGGAVGALKGVRNLLTEVVEDDRKFAKNPNKPDKLRQEAVERIRRIDRVLKQLKPLTDKTINSVDDVNNMTVPALERFVEGSTDDELNALSPEIQKSIQVKFQ